MTYHLTGPDPPPLILWQIYAIGLSHTKVTAVRVADGQAAQWNPRKTALVGPSKPYTELNVEHPSISAFHKIFSVDLYSNFGRFSTSRIVIIIIGVVWTQDVVLCAQIVKLDT